MRHTFILERARHMQQRIGTADIIEQRWRQPTALSSAAAQPADIDVLDIGRWVLLGVEHLRQHVQTLVGHLDGGDIRLQLPRGVGCSLSCAAGQSVKYSSLAAIRKTNNSNFHAHPLNSTSYTVGGFLPAAAWYLHLYV